MRNENDRNIFNEFNCATLKVRYTFLIRRAFFFRRRRSKHPFLRYVLMRIAQIKFFETETRKNIA